MHFTFLSSDLFISSFFIDDINCIYVAQLAVKCAVVVAPVKGFYEHSIKPPAEWLTISQDPTCVLELFPLF
jgi:hypothetical protein